MTTANPRRSSHSSSSSFSSNHQISVSLESSSNNNNNTPFQAQTLTTITLFSLKKLMKKPLAFPLLLLIFILLTWASLRLQQHSLSPQQQQQKQKWIGRESHVDHNANLVRFPASRFPSLISKDHRGWLLDPLSISLHAGIFGGAVTCASVHVGEIRVGGMRGNHRHHTCNETFVIWGAKTIFRLENNEIDGGYAEVVVGADEVAVAASPSGKAHAMVNVDPVQITFFLGCQDNIINYNSSTSDFNVWKDL